LICAQGFRYTLFLQGSSMRCLFGSNPNSWDVHGVNHIITREVAAEMKKLAPYLRPHGGGVTISGGEPLLQPHFVAAVFQEAHALGLTSCIDTSGQGTEHHDWDIVLPHTDMALLDQISTSMMQKGALRFADELTKRSIPFWARYVLLSGYTDDPDDLQKLVEWVKMYPTCKVDF
jgi:pyruvate formate lyase activating enzyme